MKVNYILFVVISMFSLIYSCCLISSCTKATCNSKVTFIENSNDIITEVENDNVVNTDNNVYTPWVLVASDVVTTVYNAVPNQCDSTPNYTASGFKLDLTNVVAHKIIAMERTFMKELGLKYGDVVKIEGTGKYDGVWQIQDTMNKRYAGQHKIDLLVDKSIKLGKWTNVKLYVLADKELTEFFKKDFASSL